MNISEKNPLRTTKWTVSWIIQIVKVIFFVSPTDKSQWYRKRFRKRPVFCPFVKFLIFLMRNLVHGNSIAAKENSRNNFYLLSLPSPWEEAMIRNSHSLGVGKKLNRGTIWETHERGDLNKIGRSHFRLMGHPCYRVFNRNSDICRFTRKVSGVCWKYTVLN